MSFVPHSGMLVACSLVNFRRKEDTSDLARGWRKLQSGTLYGKLACRPELDRSDNLHPAIVNLLDDRVTECFGWLHLWPVPGWLLVSNKCCLSSAGDVVALAEPPSY